MLPVETAGRVMIELKMLRHVRPIGSCLLACAMVLVGCSSRPDRVPAQMHIAPYDTSRGEVLWGVVPLRNETGTVLADTLALSDQLVSAAEQVRGVRTVPLNRTIAAMRSLGLTELTSAEDAQQLAAEMGVDGLIVGTVTAWDPYDPPTIGLALALYARPGMLGARGAEAIDTRTLASQATDTTSLLTEQYVDRPVSVASEVLDSKQQQVLMELDRYVEGRQDPTAVLGSSRYLASMDLYSEFAAWHMVGRLVESEWLRVSRSTREAIAERR